MDANSGLTDSCPGNVQGVSGYLFLTLINSLLGSKCKLGSREGYNEDYGPKLQNGDEFDFIVIGSGSAGSVVANKLSENKDWRVLVLEAGTYPSATSDIPALLFSLQGTEEDWQYKTEPSETSCLAFKDGQCRWARGRVLGGTSTLNVMLYLKGNKRDYDHWAELGNIGWDWDSVKEHFKKLENLQGLEDSDQYGRDGYLTLTRYDSGHPIKHALNEANGLFGYPILTEEDPANPLGTIEASMCIDKGIRLNSAKAFLGKVKDRTNLVTAMNSFVQKIVIDPKTKTATGVSVKIGGNVLKLKAKKEVIVSGGTINSPQILMLSGVGPKNHLEEIGVDLIKDLPVGENLEDHLIHIGFDVTLDPDSMVLDNPLENLYNYFMFQKGPMSEVGLTNYLNFINTKNDSLYPNICNHFFFYPAGEEYLLPEYARASGIVDEIFVNKRDATKNRPGLTFFLTLLNPKSRGRILLRSENSEEKPIIHSGYLSDPNDEDIQVMLESIRYAEKLIQTPAFKKFNPKLIKFNLPACEKYEYRSDEYWKCSVRHLSTTIYHPTGTCKMGPTDDGTSVVDARLRVHGIDNLRVVDASIMPKIVSANPHASVMMIGHKAGVMITEDWIGDHDEL